MKMKHLVLGTLCLTLCASTVWAKPKILDGSVLGRWTFDNPSDYGQDSSGYDAGSFAFSSTKMEGLPGSTDGSFDQSGFLHVKTAGASVTCTLGGNQSLDNSTYYTYVGLFKATGNTISVPDDDDQAALVADLNDRSGAWHFGVKRYQKNAAYNSKMIWMIATDPESDAFWNSKPRSEIGTDNTLFIGIVAKLGME